MGLREANTKTVQIPGELGAWVKLRPLTGPQMDEAKWLHVTTLAARLKGIDLEAFATMRPATASAPDAGYDRAYLVDHAVVAWSYGEIDGKPSELLDAATFAFLAGEVETMNTRPLPSAPASGTA